MLARQLKPLLRHRLKRFPAVALYGPRQCGKTTLARSLKGAYFDLQDEGHRQALDLRWDELTRQKGLIILDEAQAFHEVFPRLRGAIDRERGRHGRFLLLGSISPSLTRQVAESLAGRIAQIELTPFLYSERKATHDEHWLKGGYPPAWAPRGAGFPLWHDNYVQTLVGRDLPAWGLSSKPLELSRFVRVLAGLHGKIWNASETGRSLGLSYHTVDRYLDYLDGAFLVRRLQPFDRDIGKRVIRHPKIIWRDSGLAHALLGIHSHDQLLTFVGAGASWEAYVIEQILGSLLAKGVTFTPSYLRSSDGREIDLIIEKEGKIWALEIKLSSNPSVQDLEKLDRHAALIKATHKLLVSRTKHSQGDARRASTHLEGAVQFLLKS